jgi:hypothetical protein
MHPFVARGCHEESYIFCKNEGCKGKMNVGELVDGTCQLPFQRYMVSQKLVPVAAVTTFLERLTAGVLDHR